MEKLVKKKIRVGDLVKIKDNCSYDEIQTLIGIVIEKDPDEEVGNHSTNKMCKIFISERLWSVWVWNSDFNVIEQEEEVSE